MAQYFARSLLGLIAVLIVVSIVTFALMHEVPGGPFAREKKLPQTVLDNLNAKYNLDEPVWKQYLNYMGDLLIPKITTGPYKFSVTDDHLFNIELPFGDNATLRWMNFGPSYTDRTRSVNGIIQDHLPISFQLGVAAMVVATVIGIPLGTAAALRKNTPVDYFSMSVAILGVSVPAIVLGPLLQYVVAVELNWLPTTGWGSFEQLIMPAFALGFAQSALIARLTRASLLQVLNEDYIRTANAKGLPNRQVVWLHAMKNAMIPVVTVMGPLFAALVTGTFVIEKVFGLPGLGYYFVVSINQRDYATIMGTTLLFAFFIVIANFIVDLTYVWLDPRIRFND